VREVAEGGPRGRHLPTQMGIPGVATSPYLPTARPFRKRPRWWDTNYDAVGSSRFFNRLS